MKEIVAKYESEIKRLEEQKHKYGEKVNLPLHYLDSYDSNKLCYLNGKLEIYNKVLKDLREVGKC